MFVSTSTCEFTRTSGACACTWISAPLVDVLWVQPRRSPKSEGMCTAAVTIVGTEIERKSSRV